jgi:hypothetical protein
MNKSSIIISFILLLATSESVPSEDEFRIRQFDPKQPKSVPTLRLNSRGESPVEIWIKTTGKVPVPIGTPVPVATLSELTAILDKWPVIRLVVIPSPPRDYSITINGHSVPATERGEYAVPSGTAIQIYVRRADYPPCNWSGRVQDNQLVTCRLP